jgi:hypothetical protein
LDARAAAADHFGADRNNSYERSYLFFRKVTMPHDGSGRTSLLKPQALNALRDLVYSDLLSFLPPASIDQAQMFIANLGMPKESIGKFLQLCVSPEIAETPYKTISPSEILRLLDDRYGEYITAIAGFYRDGRGRLCWTLPTGCALYGYRSQTNFLNGILCQPLYAIGKFWLLSSAKFGGPKALRLKDSDAALFEAGLLTYPVRIPQRSHRRGAVRV